MSFFCNQQCAKKSNCFVVAKKLVIPENLLDLDDENDQVMCRIYTKVNPLFLEPLDSLHLNILECDKVCYLRKYVLKEN